MKYAYGRSAANKAGLRKNHCERGLYARLADAATANRRATGSEESVNGGTLQTSGLTLPKWLFRFPLAAKAARGTLLPSPYTGDKILRLPVFCVGGTQTAHQKLRQLQRLSRQHFGIR